MHEPTAVLDVGALFEDFAPRVLAFCHRMLGDRTEAEDATQETFLKAHRAARSFEAGCAPSTWLFAIARNTCLDRLRTRGLRTFDSLEALLAEAGTAPEGTAVDAARQVERTAYVEAVRDGCLTATLSALSPDQRAAFVLRVFCGLSTAEAALVLRRTENAVRLLLHRARTALREFLCRSCSWYDAANECRCENLVDFSLARGWIGPGDRRLPAAEVATAAARAASLIEEASRLTALYATLPGAELGAQAITRIRDCLATAT